MIAWHGTSHQLAIRCCEPCTMSRTCTAKTLLVMQPFAPMLFRQGPLPGPQLMMEFWHGRLAAEGVEAAWKTAEASHSKAKYRLEDIAWPCGICKEELLSSHYGVAPKMNQNCLAQYWERIMVPGEWRICMKCKGSLRGPAKHTTYESMSSRIARGVFQCRTVSHMAGAMPL